MKTQPKQTQVYQLTGIDLSDGYPEGSMVDCLNVSSRRYPYFANRKGRQALPDKGDLSFINVDAITAWNRLVVVKGTKMYYDGEEVTGSVTAVDPTSSEYSARPKQFAVVNTKLVIMPDKKYLDLPTKTLIDMAANIDITMSVTTAPPQEAESSTSEEQIYLQTLTITGGYSTYASAFAALNKNDGINITLGDDKFTLIYSKVEQNNTDLVAYFLKSKKDNFTAKTYSSGTRKLERRIPDFDYICDSDNRIWGCVNSEQTIYASALGDPTNYFDYSGESTDSYAVAVGTEGDFTGCHKLGSSVLFFKEYCMHKVVGSYPAEYAIYTYTMAGIKEGCYRSIQVINESIIFMANNGIYYYTGGTPTCISKQLGDFKFTDGIAGSDGNNYYLSCKEGDKNHLFVYDIKNGLWIREDECRVDGFCRNNGDLLMLIDKTVYAANKADFNEEWYIQFNSIHELQKNRNGSRAGTFFEKKKYSKLLLRAELPQGSYLVAKVRVDDGRWTEIGGIYGKFDNVTRFVIPLNRCDKFDLRLEGKGEFALLNLSRLYSMGSDRSE